MRDNIQFVRRNPHHWDVLSDYQRIMTVRGEPGRIVICGQCHGGVDIDVRFGTGAEALAFIASQLSQEPSQ